MESGKEHLQTAVTDHQPMKKSGSDASLSPSGSACFDCNICLDFAAEPVVTLCGHLYCWPCIYKWLNQSDDDNGDTPQQCPVCKASLSQASLVPLYGRGHCAKPSLGVQDIPRRPPSTHRIDRRPESPRVVSSDHNSSPRPHQQQQHFHTDRAYYPYSDHGSQPASPLRTPTRMLHYTSGGVLGGTAVAVLPWVFRGREASMQYSSPYGGVPPRLRRQEMEVERSLHQIWVFLCCCALLCLLLF